MEERRLTTTATLLITLLAASPLPGADTNASLSKVTSLLAAGQEPVRIVCFGDSITGVYYHTGGRRAWCDMLGIALKRIYPKARIEMINAGISGHSTVQALARLKKDVLDKKPNLVVVMFGMNDVVAGDRTRFCENLRSIVRQCRYAGADVVLCTPNAIYPEDDRRPVDRLAGHVADVRKVADELKAPLADCHAAYDAIKAKDRIAWATLMSDAIHPAMNGHKVFAEIIAEVIGKKRVSLADVPPAPLSVPHTLDLLAQGKPVKLVAMQPYDAIIPKVIADVSPSATVQTTPWEVRGKSIGELEAAAKGVRDMHPNLVVVAIPPDIKVDRMEQFIRSYHWVLNWGLSFALAEWDLVVVMPSVTRPSTSSGAAEVERVMREVTLGHDLGVIDRTAGDSSPPERILFNWFKGQQRAFREAGKKDN